MQNIFISDPESHEKKLNALDTNIIIVSDWDHTVTKGKGDSLASFGLLQTVPDIDPGFHSDRDALFRAYYPYEIDPHLTKTERDIYMDEWWRKAIALHGEYGFTTRHLDDIDPTQAHIRDGWTEFLGFLESQRTPVHFLSAGITQIIMRVLDHHELHTENVSIMSNTLLFGEDGKYRGHTPNPTIHTGNKNDHSQEISDKQIILFGDSIDDVSMIADRYRDAALKIAFYNDDARIPVSRYSEVYDVVIQDNRGDSRYLEQLISAIRSR